VPQLAFDLKGTVGLDVLGQHYPVFFQLYAVLLLEGVAYFFCRHRSEKLAFASGPGFDRNLAAFEPLGVLQGKLLFLFRQGGLGLLPELHGV
jgi:hypothetical protein